MDALTSHFEQKLNTWFQGFMERVSLSPVGTDGWVLDSLRSLGKQKEQLARILRDGVGDSNQVHQQLTLQANELLETVLVQEGPTAFPWLNGPLRSLERFLAGDILAGGTVEALNHAFLQVQDRPEAGPLREPLRLLMLWSQGHLVLDGLAVKGLLADCVAGARAMEVDLCEVDYSLDELVGLLEQEDLDDRDYHADLFIEKLEQWEDELFRLEEEMGALAGSSLEALAATFDSFSLLKAEVEAILESESADWAGVSLLLGGLRVEWEAASEIVNAVLLRHSQERAQEVSFAHLDGLELAVSRFQCGVLTTAELQTEVVAHSRRWSSVVDILRAEWADHSGNLCLVNSVDQALGALATILSPGDARLAPITQLYTSSLKSLLRHS